MLQSVYKGTITNRREDVADSSIYHGLLMTSAPSAADASEMLFTVLGMFRDVAITFTGDGVCAVGFKMDSS